MSHPPLGPLPAPKTPIVPNEVSETARVAAEVAAGLILPPAGAVLTLAEAAEAMAVAHKEVVAARDNVAVGLASPETVAAAMRNERSVYLAYGVAAVVSVATGGLLGGVAKRVARAAAGALAAGVSSVGAQALSSGNVDLATTAQAALIGGVLAAVPGRKPRSAPSAEPKPPAARPPPRPAPAAAKPKRPSGPPPGITLPPPRPRKAPSGATTSAASPRAARC